MKGLKGHTLLEVIITIAIFGLLLAAVFNIFVPGIRIFKIGSARAEIQSNVVFALRRIKKELSSSTTSSITVNSADIYSVTEDPHAISFLSSYKDVGGTMKIQLDYNTCSMPVWQKYVIYYCDFESGELRRKEKPLIEESPVALAMTHMELYDICKDNVTYEYTIVSKNISSMAICRTGPSLVKIELGAKKREAGLTGTQEQETKCFIEVFPHNSAGN